MFDIGINELIIIAIITLIVVGPKEIPSVLKILAKTIRKIRKTNDLFQNKFDELIHYPDEDIKDIKDIKDIIDNDTNNIITEQNLNSNEQLQSTPTTSDESHDIHGNIKLYNFEENPTPIESDEVTLNPSYEIKPKASSNNSPTPTSIAQKKDERTNE